MNPDQTFPTSSELQLFTNSKVSFSNLVLAEKAQDRLTSRGRRQALRGDSHGGRYLQEGGGSGLGPCYHAGKGLYEQAHYFYRRRPAHSWSGPAHEGQGNAACGRNWGQYDRRNSVSLGSDQVLLRRGVILFANAGARDTFRRALQRFE